MRKAFTLIELLVVIAIIAILAAMLFPVFTQAKLQAKKTQSINNVRQIAMASMMYLSDNDETTMPLYWYDPANLSEPTSRGFYYWGLLLHPYTKSYDVLLCPQDRGDDPSLADPDGRGRFDPKSQYKAYILGANPSYGLNFRYLNQTLNTPSPNRYVGINSGVLANPSSTVMFGEATMKDKTIPGGAPGMPALTVTNDIGYARIESPYGVAPSVPGWNAYTYPDARSQGQLWPRFSKTHVTIAWLDGHVKATSIKQLKGTGSTQVEVDRYFNGQGE